MGILVEFGEETPVYLDMEPTERGQMVRPVLSLPPFPILDLDGMASNQNL